eukprot:7479883-Pyramimonas_sp.AAC.1
MEPNVASYSEAVKACEEATGKLDPDMHSPSLANGERETSAAKLGPDAISFSAAMKATAAETKLEPNITN